jgi:hypothetical protein
VIHAGVCRIEGLRVFGTWCYEVPVPYRKLVSTRTDHSYCAMPTSFCINPSLFAVVVDTDRSRPFPAATLEEDEASFTARDLTRTRMLLAEADLERLRLLIKLAVDELERLMDFLHDGLRPLPPPLGC